MVDADRQKIFVSWIAMQRIMQSLLYRSGKWLHKVSYYGSAAFYVYNVSVVVYLKTICHDMTYSYNRND